MHDQLDIYNKKEKRTLTFYFITSTQINSTCLMDVNVEVM